MVRRNSFLVSNQQRKCQFLFVQRNKHMEKYGSPQGADGQVLHPAPLFPTLSQTMGTEAETENIQASQGGKGGTWKTNG